MSDSSISDRIGDLTCRIQGSVKVQHVRYPDAADCDKTVIGLLVNSSNNIFETHNIPTPNMSMIPIFFLAFKPRLYS